MTVEQKFEDSLSPRARDTITYMENHVNNYLKPTRKPTSKHNQDMSHEEKVKLAKFDLEFAERVYNTPPEKRLSTNL